MNWSLSNSRKGSFAPHGWLGLLLVCTAWPLNWLLPGMRTLFLFFPLWLGYVLIVDALTLQRKGTSLIYRSGYRYIGLFLVSAPAWWLFEALNLRVQNWVYIGSERLTQFQFGLAATVNFSTVIPAIFGTAELIGTTAFIRNLKPGLIIRPDGRTTLAFFFAGWGMLALLLLWPAYFFPFLWLSVYFILEPLNVWLGNRHLAEGTQRGDWRGVVSLWLGALLTGLFWEMWNFYAFPKWIYHVPGVSFLHVFEMPLLGYGGYLPFSMEIYALYHLAVGLLGKKNWDYITPLDANR